MLEKKFSNGGLEAEEEEARGEVGEETGGAAAGENVGGDLHDAALVLLVGAERQLFSSGRSDAFSGSKLN